MRMPQNLENLTSVLTKHLFLLSSVKTSGRFFQIFVAFSEKLDFTQLNLCHVHLRLLGHLTE